MFSGEKDMVYNSQIHDFCGFSQDLPVFLG